MDWKKVLFSRTGRLRRRDFWTAALLMAVVSAPLKLLGPIGAVLSLAFLYPHICISVKRLHDIGLSGWWMLAPFAMFVAGGIAAGFSEGASANPVGGIAGGLVVIAAVVAVLWAFLRPGDPGANRYGPSPKLQVDPAVFA